MKERNIRDSIETLVRHLIGRSFPLLRSAARGWSTIRAAAGEPAAAGVAGRAVATEVVDRDEACREAAETGAEVATRLAAEATLLAEAARAGDEALVPREAVTAAEEEATAEAVRAAVVLLLPVDVGTGLQAVVAGTRGRSLGEGAEQDPGITRRRRPRPRRKHLRRGQRRRSALLDPSVSASPVLLACLTFLTHSVFPW